MPKTAQRKLTSEQRCRKAFDSWFPRGLIEEMSLEASVRHSFAWRGWEAAWKYLQSHLEEYVKS